MMKAPLWRRLFYAGALCSTSVAGALAVERAPSAVDAHSSVAPLASGVIAFVRFSRSLYAAAHVILDYRALFARHADYHSERYKRERSVVHSRAAERALALCRTQGAVYVKIAQHVASMSHAVPPEFREQLRQLEDRAAPRPFWQIQRMLNRQLPRGIAHTFSRFDAEPVAAASLAQVHRATLRETGEAVAVKVQYPGLESLLNSDLVTIEILSWLMSFVFPFFNMHWVVEQFRNNLQKELDFELEAASAMRTAHFFDRDERVCVPRVYAQYTTPKVLVMQYIDGFRVDDVERMHRAGIGVQNVAQAVVDAFAQMIFMNGFVHCDPHAGNLMVTADERNNFKLYLLDHGLYRELSDSFRHTYCELWKGLVLRNSALVEKACEELGAPGFANVFSLFLLNRSWNFARQLGTDLRVKMSAEEMGRIRQDLTEGGLKSQADVSQLIEAIPDDLLLVFKMNSLVRNVNKALGASVNRFKVNARYAVRGLRVRNERRGGAGAATAAAAAAAEMSGVVASNRVERRVWMAWRGVWKMVERVALWTDCAAVEVQLLLIDVCLWVYGAWARVRGARRVQLSDERALIG